MIKTFLDNMQVLEKYFPELSQKMTALESSLDPNLVRTTTGKNGVKVLKTGRKYFHDRKDPYGQAKEFIGRYQGIEEHSDILFYGLGQGFHIRAFAEQYPGLAFSIYEPVPEVFYQFLCHYDLNTLPLHQVQNIYLESSSQDMDDFCAKFVSRIRSSVLIIDLPAYQTIFPGKRQSFFSRLEYQIGERRSSLATVSTFEKRWTVNSMKNIVQVLSSPNIIIEKGGCFKNKPALLVASGPSLEEEMDNLRIIREKGLAYIFSAGTAINAMVKKGIHPHAACTYDPSEDNQIFNQEVAARNIESIPIIFGSTVAHEMLEKYPGPKWHMLINQDTPAAFYLKPQGGKGLEAVNDATTIAVITLQLLYKLGFNPIILVGLNLAYRGSRCYAAGATFHPLEVNQQELADSLTVKDVLGRDASSNPTFIRMRQQIEAYLDYIKDTEVINTTNSGAYIEGTRFQSLAELISNRLQVEVVEDDWLKARKYSYDMDYLVKQSRKMREAQANVAAMIEKSEINLQTIIQAANAGDLGFIGQSYDMFNHEFARLRENHFFSTFIMPMNRVEQEMLALAVPQISEENDPVLKAQMMNKEFGQYIINCKNDIESVGLQFQEMNQELEHFYCRYMIGKKAVGIKILLLDVDGILTDGTVYYSSAGDELKKFNYKDRAGIDRLNKMGIKTLLIDRQDSPATRKAAERLGIAVVSSGERKQIIESCSDQYHSAEMACLFNILEKEPRPGRIGFVFAAKNASPGILKQADYVLAAGGGEGLVWEIAELLSNYRDKIYRG